MAGSIRRKPRGSYAKQPQRKGILASWPSDRERTPEIRSGRARSDARADRWVPRVSGPGIPGARCEHGRSLAGGAHGSATRTIGRGKQRDSDKRGHEEVGPACQRWRARAGATSRARADRRGPPGSDQERGKKGGD
jgi:hypothetical protein